MVNKSLRVSLYFILMLLLLGGMGCAGSPLEGTASPVPLETSLVTAPVSTPLALATSPVPESTDAAGDPLMLEAPVNLDALQVVKLTNYTDSQGQQVIAGILLNPTGAALTGVNLELLFYDNEGHMITIAQAQPSVEPLLPGGTVPFWLVLPSPVQGAVSLVVQAVEGRRAEEAFTSVQVSGIGYSQDPQGNLYIFGELLNEQEQPAALRTVAVAAYGENDVLLTAGEAMVFPAYLGAAGEATGDLQSAPFRATLAGPVGGFSSVQRVEAWVEAVPTSPASLDIGMSDFYSFSDPTGKVTLVGEVTNLANTAVQVRLLAGIYAQSGQVLDAAFGDLPFFFLRPGETLPFAINGWGPVQAIAGVYADQAYDATIQVDPLLGADHPLPVELDIADHTAELLEGQALFRGLVVNNSPAPVGQAVVIGYLRSTELGMVVSTGYVLVVGAVPVGGSAAYTLTLPIPEKWVGADLELYVLARGIQD